MSCDEFIEWWEQKDQIELYEYYIKEKKLLNDFEEWLFNAYSSEQQDQAEYFYEMEKDKRLEE